MLTWVILLCCHLVCGVVGWALGMIYMYRPGCSLVSRVSNFFLLSLCGVVTLAAAAVLIFRATGRCKDA